MSIKKIKVTTAELADLLDVSEGYISQLVLEHGYPKEDHNSFKLFDFVQKRFAHLKEMCDDRIKKLREENSKSRLERVNAEIKELDLAEKKNLLIPYDLVLDAWLEQIQLTVSKVEFFPSKVAPLLLGITDQKEMFRLLTDEVIKLRIEIANSKLRIDKSVPPLDGKSVSKNDKLQVD